MIHLMEDETMDQIEVPMTLIDEQQARWLQDGMQLKVSTLEGQPFSVTLPMRATLQVREAPVAKSGENLKLATLENGVKIRVPTYIETGELITVTTADGAFHSRSGE